jgi:hypothetical protein
VSGGSGRASPAGRGETTGAAGGDTERGRARDAEACGARGRGAGGVVGPSSGCCLASLGPSRLRRQRAASVRLRCCRCVCLARAPSEAGSRAEGCGGAPSHLSSEASPAAAAVAAAPSRLRRACGRCDLGPAAARAAGLGEPTHSGDASVAAAITAPFRPVRHRTGPAPRPL